MTLAMKNLESSVGFENLATGGASKIENLFLKKTANLVDHDKIVKISLASVIIMYKSN